MLVRNSLWDHQAMHPWRMEHVLGLLQFTVMAGWLQYLHHDPLPVTELCRVGPHMPAHALQAC